MLFNTTYVFIDNNIVERKYCTSNKTNTKVMCNKTREDVSVSLYYYLVCMFQIHSNLVTTCLAGGRCAVECGWCFC